MLSYITSLIFYLFIMFCEGNLKNSLNKVLFQCFPTIFKGFFTQSLVITFHIYVTETQYYFCTGI